MYEETVSFDPNTFVQHEADNFSSTHINQINFNNKNQSFVMDDDHHHHQQQQQQHSFPQNPISEHDIAAAMELELENQLNMEMENRYNANNNENQMPSHDQNRLVQEMSGFIGDNVHNHHHGNFTDMFTIPKCTQSSLPFTNMSHSVYDPLLPLNLPPQLPLLRSEPNFHSFSNVSFNGNGSLFGGVDNGDHFSDERRFDDHGVFVFGAGEIDCLGKSRDGKDTKHFATEKHRRVQFNDKFQALRKLIPCPTKNDRASIVGDAIGYIHELKRTVAELQGLVEKKRCDKERLKRLKTEGNDSKSQGDMGHCYNDSSLRSSWLHRKSKNSEVDVRIIDDEVNVKLVQQKRINCLLFVLKVLDELQLDLHHVAGGIIGDYYSFLFNSKICEGSIVYASAIANKIIEVVDEEYAAMLPTSSY